MSIYNTRLIILFCNHSGVYVNHQVHQIYFAIIQVSTYIHTFIKSILQYFRCLHTCRSQDKLHYSQIIFSYIPEFNSRITWTKSHCVPTHIHDCIWTTLQSNNVTYGLISNWTNCLPDIIICVQSNYCTQSNYIISQQLSNQIDRTDYVSTHPCPRRLLIKPITSRVSNHHSIKRNCQTNILTFPHTVPIQASLLSTLIYRYGQFVAVISRSWLVTCTRATRHTNGAGTAYPSGAPEFTSVLSAIRAAQSLVFCVDDSLSFYIFLLTTV